MIESLAKDIRFAIRTLWNNRAFTLVAVLTLGLGIGANVAIFSWTNAVLLSPLPGVKDSGNVLTIVPTTETGSILGFSYPDYVDVRDRATTLEGPIVYDPQAVGLAKGNETAERVWGMLVSGNYFDVLGVGAVHGRTFLPEEDATPGTHPVAVMGHALWKSRFGGDPSVVGSTVRINDRPFTIVGVAAEGFRGTDVGLSYDLWIPMMMQEQIVSGGDRLGARGQHWLNGLARTKPGVSLEAARAELESISQQMAETSPDSNEGIAFRLHTFWDAPVGAPTVFRPVLLVLTIVVGLVLLIACANVANLLLARASRRQREIAIRLALGASRRQLVQQLLVESMLLALLGGAVGLLIGAWSSGLLMTLAPATDRTIFVDMRIDTTALGFCLLVSIATGVLFGLAPALSATRPNLVPSLKDEGSGHTSGGSSRFRSGLVVAQVALSTVLLVCAGLLLQSLFNAKSFDPGFNVSHVVVASVDLFASGYDEETGRSRYRQLLDRIRALPGVTAVSTGRKIPLALTGTSSTSFTSPDIDLPGDDSPFAFYNNVGPKYFETMQIPIMSGRDLLDTDDEDAPTVAVVNEAFVRKYWPGQDALGKGVKVFGKDASIVGVARDTAHRRLAEPPPPYLFLSTLQYYNPEMFLHVRAEGGTAAVAAAVRSEAAALDSALLLNSIQTLEAVTSAGALQQRMTGTMLAVFGVLALALAAVGIYGVLAYTVTQRTREIGIRMALGAGRRDVLGLVMRQGILLAGGGLVVGVALALGAARLLGSLLFGVSATDGVTYGAVAVVLLAVALLACLVPALRAMRVDPMKALRYE